MCAVRRAVLHRQTVMSQPRTAPLQQHTHPSHPSPRPPPRPPLTEALRRVQLQQAADEVGSWLRQPLGHFVLGSHNPLEREVLCMWSAKNNTR